MRQVSLIGLLLALLLLPAAAQAPQAPIQIVNDFYRLLREKRYVEGFRLSVYESAVNSLSAAELEDLRPDFDSTFGQIPPTLQLKGEQIVGDSAFVWVQVNEKATPESVGLVRINGQWRVGDLDTYKLVQQQGREFFFNARLFVNERETADMLKALVSATMFYMQNNKGRIPDFATIVQSATDVPKELAGGVARGYKFELRQGNEGGSFYFLALPVKYGKTGRISFYANIGGVRGQDLKGRNADVTTQFFQY